jgi:hypothetical protein
MAVAKAARAVNRKTEFVVIGTIPPKEKEFVVPVERIGENHSKTITYAQKKTVGTHPQRVHRRRFWRKRTLKGELPLFADLVPCWVCFSNANIS